MLAYLVMMAPRLVELRRTMKPTASIYLHCDPTASHYLKMLMDAAFGPQNFQNEIIWQRTSSHSDTKRWGRVHDTLLFYSRAAEMTWNPQFMPHDAGYVHAFYRYQDDKGRYRLHEIVRTASMGPRPNLAYDYRGYTPQWGWRMVREKLEALDRDGRIAWSKSGRPYLKRYLHEQKGTPIRSVITEIPPVGAQAAERLGYPTQKPQALLERIISASSNPGDLVLDPFCGCGTTIAAAQKLGRAWIGIDITHLAINLIKKRLKDSFGIDAVVQTASPQKTDVSKAAEAPADYGDPTKRPYAVIGEPVSLPDAERLAESDPYQFQWWALGLVGARPTEQKKGADRGIDGKIVFQGDKTGVFESVILSVKAGKTGPAHVRDLKGVLDREKAAIGVLITMHEPTRAMKIEAASAGFYEWRGPVAMYRKYPKLQLLTVAELLDGKQIDMPPRRQVDATFKKAPRAPTRKRDEQLLFDA